MHNASFAYAGEEKDLLSAVNLSLEPGRLYGLVGAPCSGTSTLLKLLAQKMPWRDGQMSFQGTRWALIDEEAELFSGSLG